ncbi:MAG: hypothetical protein MNSN_10660 [Minisyncoccus archaeiphilus]|uniref:hypothetical protein n=1 Tax=Minisyncoccus archaeiphilus TaxID=3238481 RepID=UPI002B16B6DA|nr:MAG: hypothetical protein MNSN_10660 [Candidatus Parcubacteria bacterium]
MNITPPPKLSQEIGPQRDFAIKGKKTFALLSFIIIAYTILALIVLISFFYPILINIDPQSSNGILTILLFLVFLSIPLSGLWYIIKSSLLEGDAYYASNAEKLVVTDDKDKITSIHWKDIENTMTLGKDKGCIFFKIKSFNENSKVIGIFEIDNVKAINDICQRRIKENSSILNNH